AVSSLDKFHIKRYKNHPISPIGIVGIFSEILNEFLDSLTLAATLADTLQTFSIPTTKRTNNYFFQKKLCV
ncbi:hypothetical protein U3A58_21635, partial [Algoriphagus sp. C2-6-M1]|uniref:hypothetical protein n=1 Tax=Algoriphagus persicinus TaxID=3108754 RepID=UPI002B3ACFBF